MVFPRVWLVKAILSSEEQSVAALPRICLLIEVSQPLLGITSEKKETMLNSDLKGIVL